MVQYLRIHHSIIETGEFLGAGVEKNITINCENASKIGEVTQKGTKNEKIAMKVAEMTRNNHADIHCFDPKKSHKNREIEKLHLK